MIKLKYYKYNFFNKRLLNSWESTISAYGILFILLFLLPILDNEYSKQNINYILLILLNTCLLILEVNAVIQKNKRPTKLWLLVNLPLWFSVPSQINFIINGFIGLLHLSK